MAIPFAPRSAGVVTMSGHASSWRPDSDPSNNQAGAQAMAGRVYLDTSLVSGRVPWGLVDPAAITQGAALVNDSPLGLTFNATASDPERRDVVPGWFDVTPAYGTVGAFSTEKLVVSMWALDLAPGLHRGRVSIAHDSPY